MDKSNADRISWLDSCKGFAIMLVVFGHIVDGYMDANMFPKYELLMTSVHNVIYSFHMPLFFVLSGYIFYRVYGVGKSEKKQKFRLQIVNNIYIYIYILFSGIFWFTKMLFNENVNNPYTVSQLIMVLIKPFGPYWYLYVLTFYYLIFYCIPDRKTGRIKTLIVFAVIGFAGSAIGFFTDFGGWLSAIPFLKNIAFFALGIYISKASETKLISKTSLVITLVGSIVSFACVIVFNVNMFSIPVVGIISAGCISLFTVNLFSSVKLLENSKVFCLCGRYSLEIYVTHCFITAANRIILIKLGITVFGFNVLVNFLMAAFIPILCSFIMKKIGIHKPVFRPFAYIKEKNKQG